MQTRVEAGAAALARLEELQPLLHQVDAPITARPAWWHAWAASRQGTWEPLLVTVHDGTTPVAAAALAVHAGPLIDRLVVWGHEESDVALLPARDHEAAEELAEVLVGLLRRRPRPWSLRLEQLPCDDPVAARLVQQLPGARRLRGDGCPRTRFGADRALSVHLTRNGRKALNQARNRLAREGLQVTLGTSRSAADVAALLPEVVALRRRRDHQRGRPAALDRPERRAFFDRVVTALAQEDAVELTTAHLQGRLAAYVLALRDGAWLRLWDGRVDPVWDPWSLGRVVDLHVLEQALADPALVGVDWMRGEESYKGRAAPVTFPTQHVLAASGPVVAAVVAAPAAAGEVARRLLTASPAARSVWRRAKAAALSRKS